MSSLKDFQTGSKAYEQQKFSQTLSTSQEIGGHVIPQKKVSHQAVQAYKPFGRGQSASTNGKPSLITSNYQSQPLLQQAKQLSKNPSRDQLNHLSYQNGNGVSTNGVSSTGKAM